jgi:hypothetical protein
MVLASSELEDRQVGVVRADNHDIDKHIAGYADLIKDAAQADQIEHEMGVRQALRIHKKAVFWSMALSSALIVCGCATKMNRTCLLMCAALRSCRWRVTTWS